MWCKESTCSTTSRIFCSVKLPPNYAGWERAAAGLVRVTGAPACAPPPPHRRRRRSRRSLASPRLPPKPSPPSISSFLGCAGRSTASVPGTSSLAFPSPPFAPSAPGLRHGRSPPTFRLRRHLSTVDAPYLPPACDPVFPWTRQTRQRLRPSLPCHPPGRSELRQGVSTNETHCQRRHRDGGREEEEVASVPAAEPADVAALLVHSSAIC